MDPLQLTAQAAQWLANRHNILGWRAEFSGADIAHRSLPASAPDQRDLYEDREQKKDHEAADGEQLLR